MRSLGVLLAAAALMPGISRTQSRPDDEAEALRRGAALYKSHCASCHGASARGDGPMADQLRFAPADLTRISRRNGGKFPSEKVAKIIDGREPMKGHGGTDMPVWGDIFRDSAEGYDARKAKQKIDELTRYLATVQEQGK